MLMVENFLLLYNTARRGMVELEGGNTTKAITGNVIKPVQNI